MKHEHAELIKAWADNTDTRFVFDGGGGGIICVIQHPKYDWEIAKEPRVIIGCAKERMAGS